jgi:arylsulfatase A-like enzyme
LADPGAAGEPLREVYYSSTEVRQLGQSVMVTDGRWKYIYSEANATQELYDQVRDRSELHNLAASPAHQDTLARLRHQLRQTAIDLGDTRLLDGDGFASTSVDRSTFAQVPPIAMGWRWY